MCNKAEEVRRRSEPGAVVFGARATIQATVFKASVRVKKEVTEKRVNNREITENNDRKLEDSFNYQKLKVKTTMGGTDGAVNNYMANSKDNNSLGNSRKTVIEENNIFINSDDKTDSEIVNSDMANIEDNNSLKNSIKTEESEEGNEDSKEPLLVEQKEKTSFGKL